MKRMKEGPDGWTDWAYPLHKRYRMGCCDCGLVHDLQFAVVEIHKHLKGGRFTIGDTVVKGSRGKWRVAFRARRNNRSTAQIRRHTKQG